MIFRKRSPAPPPPLEIPSGGHKPKKITQIFGVGGMGKTLYAKAIVRARLNRRGRVVVVDPNGQFEDYGKRVTIEQAKHVLATAGARPFAIVLEPDFDEEVSDVFRSAFKAGNLLLVADDCVDMAGRASLDKDLLRTVVKGRNRMVDMVLTCQNVTDLDSRIRLNHSTGVCFRQVLPDAADRFVLEYAPKYPKLAPRLLELEQFQYVRASIDGTVEVGRIPNPAVHGAP